MSDRRTNLETVQCIRDEPLYIICQTRSARTYTVDHFVVRSLFRLLCLVSEAIFSLEYNVRRG